MNSQKHLGNFLEARLNFQNQLSNVSIKCMKLIGSFKNFPISPLLIIYILFI